MHVPVCSFPNPFPSFLNCRRLSPLGLWWPPPLGTFYLMVDLAVLGSSICYHFCNIHAEPFLSFLFSKKKKKHTFSIIPILLSCTFWKTRMVFDCTKYVFKLKLIFRLRGSNMYALNSLIYTLEDQNY